MNRPVDSARVARESFIGAYGWRAAAHDLAAVLELTVEDVLRIRTGRTCVKLNQAKDFSELFAIWHGRAPEDSEWPAPRKAGGGAYEWQAPEVALLATLVGQLGVLEISDVLTRRLRERSGDPQAERGKTSVQVRINQIGLQSSDVVGGITTSEAARDVGSLALVQHAIRKKDLQPRRVGRLWVIPHAQWQAWKAKRVLPPDGYVMLSKFREPLGIKSDKLSEFARMGYVPTALRCTPFGRAGAFTKFGTWYIGEAAGKKLVADRHAGRPMPWHGKALTDNLRHSYQLWQERLHPDNCETCAHIWGQEGRPETFEDYAARYPVLAHGAKRHLTRPWTIGLTVREVAADAGCSQARVRRAMENEALEATDDGNAKYVSRTDATRWIARKCPTGDSEKSWISLDTASSQYLFTKPDLRAFIAQGRLASKKGTDGAARGVVYVPRHQCGQLREKLGFSEEEAAKRVGVTLARFRTLLEGVNWRDAEGIPLVTVQAVIKRLKSRQGYTVAEAAADVGQAEQWVKERIADGTVRVTKAPWDHRRLYLTAPMLERLRRAAAAGVSRRRDDTHWLRLGDAADEAGVSRATLVGWAESGVLRRREGANGWRYHREAVRARARTYWASVRLHRARPPEWLRLERDAGWDAGSRVKSIVDLEAHEQL